MFFGLEWYWWLVIVAVLGISVPLKVRFMKRWDESRREKKNQRGKWGDEP